ncbi:MAG: biopolymer transporter ExbD [Deltaproteobacteria bacterium]|nr:biopolymer transporter ExbD [Deltaproteobacteria bacterium]
MASTEQNGGAISAINVTPFVDVVLVLLVILMVTSTSLVKASIGVDLPRAASASETVDRTLNLVIEADGDLLLDGEVVDEQRLSETVKAAIAQDPEVRAVISADRNAPYSAVIRGIDLAKAAGLSKFALDVERGAP